GLPADAVIESTGVYGQARIRWTPSTADIGSRTVTVSVVDSGNGNAADVLADTMSFRFAVRTTNSAPAIAADSEVTLSEGETLLLQPTGTDADNDLLTWSASELPAGAEFQPATGEITWTPKATQSGDYTVTLTATDGLDTVTHDVRISVSNVNRPPFIVPPLTQFGREGLSFVYNLSVQDPDGDVFVYSSVRGLPDGAVFSSKTGTLEWTPDFDDAGLYNVTFTVLDTAGAASTATLILDVANVNRTPSLALGNQFFRLAEERSLTLHPTDADPGTVFSFSSPNLPEGAALDPSTGVFTWRPGPGQLGEHIVTFVVDDGEAQARRTVVLQVDLEPKPPTVRIELTPSFPVLPGQNVLVTVQAAGFSPIVSRTLTLDSVAVPLRADGSAVVKAELPGIHSLTATATDENGVTAVVQQELRILSQTDNAPPVVQFDSDQSSIVIERPLALAAVVSDANLDQWTLEISRRGAEQWQILATGRSSFSGPFFTLDPATVVSGVYDLRLSATDLNQRTVRDVIPVEVFGASPVLTAGAGDLFPLSVTDHTLMLQDGSSFDWQRVFVPSTSGQTGSRTDFGNGWLLPGHNVDLQTNISMTGYESSGLFTPVGNDSRVYLTASDGRRLVYGFAPTPVTISNTTFYRPAWQLLNGTDNNIRLTSAKALLRRSAGKYYLVETGQPYNPQDRTLFGADTFRLVQPDGTAWVIGPSGHVLSATTAAGQQMLIADSGIQFVDTGEFVQLIRDNRGRIAETRFSDGVILVYSYDTAGNLYSVRNLQDQSNVRYAYEDGRLTVESRSDGNSRYFAVTSGTVSEHAVAGDLGTLLTVGRQSVSGSLPASGETAYTFVLRDSELASAPDEQIYLRLQIIGGSLDSPDVANAAVLSRQVTGTTQTLILSVRQSGLYHIVVAGAAGTDYDLSLSAAGDLNHDGNIDGLDTDLFDASAASGRRTGDIDGDGLQNALDLQILFAQFGLTANQAPVWTTDAVEWKSHASFSQVFNLGELASDPEGDRLSYQIRSMTAGIQSAVVTDNLILVTPDPEFSGTALLELLVDDGFAESLPRVIALEILDVGLNRIYFATDTLLLNAGDYADTAVYADFEDGETIRVLPRDYSISVEDSSVAIVDGSRIIGQGDGEYTVLHADVTRGYSLAAVITVGVPTDFELIRSYLLGIQADTESHLLHVGDQFTPQLRLSLSEGLDSTVLSYVVNDETVINVTEDGLVTAVGVGRTSLQVIYRNAIETIEISVLEQDTTMLPTAGRGGIFTADAIQIVVPPSAFETEPEISVQGISATELQRAVPENFELITAFELNFDSEYTTYPLQLRFPAPESSAVGDRFFLFMLQMQPDADFELTPVWTLIDTVTTIGNGAAVTDGTGYQGVHRPGTYLLASANQAVHFIDLETDGMSGVVRLRIDDAETGVAVTFGPELNTTDPLGFRYNSLLKVPVLVGMQNSLVADVIESGRFHVLNLPINLTQDRPYSFYDDDVIEIDPPAIYGAMLSPETAQSQNGLPGINSYPYKALTFRGKSLTASFGTNPIPPDASGFFQSFIGAERRAAIDFALSGLPDRLWYDSLAANALATATLTSAQYSPWIAQEARATVFQQTYNEAFDISRRVAVNNGNIDIQQAIPDAESSLPFIGQIAFDSVNREIVLSVGNFIDANNAVILRTTPTSPITIFALTPDGTVYHLRGALFTDTGQKIRIPISELKELSVAVADIAFSIPYQKFKFYNSSDVRHPVFALEIDDTVPASNWAQIESPRIYGFTGSNRTPADEASVLVSRLTASREVVRRISLPGVRQINQIEATANGKLIFVATDIGLISIDGVTLEIVGTSSSVGEIAALTMNGSGTTLFAASSDGVIRSLSLVQESYLTLTSITSVELTSPTEPTSLHLETIALTPDEGAVVIALNRG
ncbi:MAG: tandem-95 repeat protein, partial [Planctomycetaceae bacterium]|nr:tandem-95 repeat protein [Planctomycetaceae bacterium]